MIPGSGYIGLKSQFVKINALKGKSSHSEQSQLLNGGSEADVQSTVPFNQIHTEKTLFGQTAHVPSKGLLAYWDAQNAQSPHHSGVSGRISVAEQNTLKQKAL